MGLSSNHHNVQWCTNIQLWWKYVVENKKNTFGSLCKMPDIFGDFTQIWSFSTHFDKSPPVSSMKESRPMRMVLVHTEGRTDAGHDEVSRHFSQPMRTRQKDGGQNLPKYKFGKICGPQGLLCTWLCLALRIISHPRTGRNKAFLVSLRRRLRFTSKPHYLKRTAWSPEEKSNLVSLRERITCQQRSCWRYQ